MVRDFRDHNLYSEYLIEYDNEALVVYFSGLDEDYFWIELMIFDEIDDPESYAQGLKDGLNCIGLSASVTKVEYEDI